MYQSVISLPQPQPYSHDTRSRRSVYITHRSLKNVISEQMWHDGKGWDQRYQGKDKKVTGLYCNRRFTARQPKSNLKPLDTTPGFTRMYTTLPTTTTNLDMARAKQHNRQTTSSRTEKRDVGKCSEEQKRANLLFPFNQTCHHVHAPSGSIISKKNLGRISSS
jgi:hypothetical protein